MALHLADHVHHLGFAGPLAPLVDDGERRVDALGEPARAHHAADVGRNHHQVVELVVLLDVAHHHRRGEQVVGRDVEEALDLAGVQVERHDAVGAGAGDQVGDELGRDRRARARFAVLPGVAEIGDHRGDAARRRAAQRVDDDQQLHQVVVGRKRRRLDHEDVGAAHVLLDLDEDLHVGEAPHHGLGQRGLEIGGDRLGELGIGVAGDELDRSVLRRHDRLLREPDGVVIPSAATGLAIRRVSLSRSFFRRWRALPVRRAAVGRLRGDRRRHCVAAAVGGLGRRWPLVGFRAAWRASATSAAARLWPPAG